jgi:hypothetical protein
MFATYAKSTMSADTYKEICELRKTGGATSALLADVTNLSKAPESKPKHLGDKKPKPPTDFQKYYVRGDFPVSVSFNGANRKLKWLVEPTQIDLGRYLPLFLMGLTETQEPYIFLGEETSLQAIAQNGDKLADILPDLILPIKAALDSSHCPVVVRGLRVLQTMLKVNKQLAESLIPFYKNLLPAFNRNIHRNLNLGDQTEYSQQKRVNVSDLMIETLNTLETHGGLDAFANIKYMVPIYESVTTKGKAK